MTKTSVHLRKIKRPLKDGKSRSEWHLRWHGTDGKHYCAKIGNCASMTKRQAEAIRRNRQVELDRGEIPRDKPKAIPLGEFADLHASMIGGDRKSSTLYEYRLSIQTAARILGERTPIHSITASDVARFRTRLTGSAATRAKHVSRLRAVFNHAKRWGLLSGDNPFANQPMPRFAPKTKRIFTIQEIEAMIAASHNAWWKAFVCVAVTAGPRKEEILNLLWRDVDFEEKVIRISAKSEGSFQTADGSAFSTLAWAPKTYAIRTIPIPDQTCDALRELNQSTDESPYIFVSLDRLRVINASIERGTRRGRAETCNNVLRQFKRLQRRAADAVHASEWQFGTIHDLRKTYGSRMADVVPMHVLQRWMGHSDVSVTAGYYLEIADHHAETARSSFGFESQDSALGAPTRQTER